MKPVLKSPLILLFLIIMSMPVLLSAGVTDSIKRQINKAHSVEQKIRLYSSLAGKYLAIDPDSALIYANKAKVLARSAHIEKYSGDIFGVMGDVFVVKDSLDLAERYYDTALVYFEKADNYSQIAGVLTVLGNINLVKNNTSKALQYYFQALHISQEHNITGRLPYLYLNIGTINMQANNIKEAQEYYAKALEGFEKTNDSLNIGRTLSSLGITYQKLNDYKQTIDYYRQALTIFKRLHSYADLAEIYYDLAVVEKLSGFPKKAIEYLNISLQNIRKIDFTYAGPRVNILARVEVELGDNYLELGDFRTAKQHLKKGFELADKNGLLATAKDGAENLSLLYEKQGQFDSALYYHKILKEKSELLINEENIKKLANIEAHYKYDRLIEEQKNEQLLERQAQRRKNIIFIVAIIILVLVALVLLLFLKLVRNKAARTELQKKNLQSELELRNRELTAQVMMQLKKNELILDISKKLQKTLSSAHPENKPIIERVIKELDSDDSQEVWKDFEIRFRNVHSDFYKKLVKRFPDLTANELRLCAFLKLNLNTKEISSLTNQSVNSIDVARSRLRQKLGLSKEDNLTSFLAGF